MKLDQQWWKEYETQLAEAKRNTVLLQEKMEKEAAEQEKIDEENDQIGDLDAEPKEEQGEIDGMEKDKDNIRTSAERRQAGASQGSHGARALSCDSRSQRNRWASRLAVRLVACTSRIPEWSHRDRGLEHGLGLLPFARHGL